jgi:hypothetical protein
MAVLGRNCRGSSVSYHRSVVNQPRWVARAFLLPLKAARMPEIYSPSLKTIPDSAICDTQIALRQGMKRMPLAEILRLQLDGAP